jgi:hypothetical protein
MTTAPIVAGSTMLSSLRLVSRMQAAASIEEIFVHQTEPLRDLCDLRAMLSPLRLVLARGPPLLSTSFSSALSNQ